MKRIFLFLLTTTVIANVFAADLSDGESWKVNALRLGAGNDAFSFSFGENHDDQLSFGEHFYIGGPVWFLSFDLLGFTNRGWRDNAEKSLYKGRYDQAQTRFGVHFVPVKGEHFILQLTPILGYSAIGNLGGEALQNMWHELFKIKPLDLPYEESCHSPELSLMSDFSWKWTKDGVFYGVGLELDFFNHFLWQYEQQILGKLFFGSGEDRIIELGLGWNWFEVFQNPTQKLAQDFFRGPRLELDFEVGAFFINRIHVFGRNFSYTKYYLDFMKLFAEPRIWTKSELFVSPVAFDPVQNTYTFKVAAKIKDLPLRVYMEDRWGSGRAFVGTSEKDNSFLTVGLQYDIPDAWSLQIVSPFVSLGAGVAKWGIFDKLPEPSWSGDNFIRDAVYSFIVDAQVGLALLPPGLLCAGRASYRLLVTAGTHMVFNFKHVNNFYDETQHDRPNVSPPHIFFFTPHVTISLEVGIDV